MNAMAQQTANWYAKMLMPLENSIKISIINNCIRNVAIVGQFDCFPFLCKYTNTQYC